MLERVSLGEVGCAFVAGLLGSVLLGHGLSVSNALAAGHPLALFCRYVTRGGTSGCVYRFEQR